MWVYSEDTVLGGWWVGYYHPKGEFQPIRQYATEAAAAKRVHYLNGGNWEGMESET